MLSPYRDVGHRVSASNRRRWYLRGIGLGRQNSHSFETILRPVREVQLRAGFHNSLKIYL